MVAVNGELRSAALRYADLGYRVFPCAPGGKKPITEHGYLDASTDPEQIERWWTEHPHANIGIATEGMVVVDIDGDGNPWLRDEPERADELAVGPIAVTPRGGTHRIFRQPDGHRWRCTESRLAPQVDTRADGGYIVAPPSVLAGGKSYRWVEDMELDAARDRLPEPPAWLAAELDRLAQPTPSAPTLGSVAAGGNEANPIPEGQRNATLASLAGTMRRVGMSQAEITAALVQANADRCVPPLRQREVEKIAGSVARYEPNSIAVALTENHWEQMTGSKPAGNGPSDSGPFPPSLLDVPGFIGEIIAYNLATAFRPQPVLALGAAIALLGTLTARKVRDEMNTRTNVYCLGVCPSGGGKERARQINKEILFLAAASEMVGPEGLASHAGLITAVENQPGLLFQLDEIGRLLRTLSDPSRSPHLYHIATNLMKLFTSSSSVYVGDAYADPKRNKVLHQPHACVYGTTVPQSLFEGLTTENVTDGFLSRVMIFEAPLDLPPKRRPVMTPVPESIVVAAKRWVDFNPGGNLNEQNPEPRLVPTTVDAHQRFADLDAASEDRQRELGEPLGTLWTRATEKAHKLALIYACSRDVESWQVDGAAARWACDVSEYLTRRLVFLASQWVAENPFDAKRKRVLRMIVQAGPDGLSRTSLYGKTRALTTRERAEVLDSLQLCGDVTELKELTGGAPRVRYVAATTTEGASS